MAAAMDVELAIFSIDVLPCGSATVRRINNHRDQPRFICMGTISA
jgi:transposase-like protein